MAQLDIETKEDIFQAELYVNLDDDEELSLSSLAPTLPSSGPWHALDNGPYSKTGTDRPERPAAAAFDLALLLDSFEKLELELEHLERQPPRRIPTIRIRPPSAFGNSSVEGDVDITNVACVAETHKR
jgi:hypothetical protein